MAIRPALGVRQVQRIALTPAMRVSLGVLRLPALALQDELAREAEDNPFLVVEAPAGLAPFPADIPDAGLAGQRAGIARQIAAQGLEAAVEAAALLLAGELREDGYLDVSLADLSAETGVPTALLEQGLAALHRCEPAGVGARDLAECLALQLADLGTEIGVARALTARLEDVAAGRWGPLSRALGLSVDEVRTLAADLRTLRPRPFDDLPADPPVRIADLAVVEGPAGPDVLLAEDALPKVAVMDVGRLSGLSPEMRALLDRARGYAGALAERSKTLLRVGELVVSRQTAFFGQGGPLLPLSRSDAAGVLGMHPSTLGRAVAGKGLLFRGTVYPLETFFARPAPGQPSELSAHEVQRRIRALVAAEDAAAPLADEAIRAHLKSEGVDIARRTVAKYRKCLRIASSFERRRRSGRA